MSKARGNTSGPFSFLDSVDILTSFKEPALEDRFIDFLMGLLARLAYDLLKWVLDNVRSWLRRKP